MDDSSAFTKIHFGFQKCLQNRIRSRCWLRNLLFPVYNHASLRVAIWPSLSTEKRFIFLIPSQSCLKWRHYRKKKKAKRCSSWVAVKEPRSRLLHSTQKVHRKKKKKTFRVISTVTFTQRLHFNEDRRGFFHAGTKESTRLNSKRPGSVTYEIRIDVRKASRCDEKRHANEKGWGLRGNIRSFHQRRLTTPCLR